MQPVFPDYSVRFLWLSFNTSIISWLVFENYYFYDQLKNCTLCCKWEKINDCESARQNECLSFVEFIIICNHQNSYRNIESYAIPPTGKCLKLRIILILIIWCYKFGSSHQRWATSKTWTRTLGPGPGLWTRTLEPDPEKPGLWRTLTLKNMGNSWIWKND